MWKLWREVKSLQVKNRNRYLQHCSVGIFTLSNIPSVYNRKRHPFICRLSALQRLLIWHPKNSCSLWATCGFMKERKNQLQRSLWQTMTEPINSKLRFVLNRSSLLCSKHFHHKRSSPLLCAFTETRVILWSAGRERWFSPFALVRPRWSTASSYGAPT